MTIGRMTVPLAAVAGLFLRTTLVAQRDTADLKKKLADKLTEEWVSNVDWITDFDKAKAEAQKQGKQIFAYFTRSYAP